MRGKSPERSPVVRIKRVKQPRRKYTKEFKVEAVKLALEGGVSQAQVAKNLGISPHLLSRWVIQFQEDAVNAFPGKGRLKPEAQRVRDLEEELRRVRMERDILKKAMAYFAKQPE